MDLPLSSLPAATETARVVDEIHGRVVRTTAIGGLFLVSGIGLALATIRELHFLLPLVPPFSAVYALTWVLHRYGRNRAGAWVAVLGNLALLSFTVWMAGGLAGIVPIFFCLLPVLSAMVLGARAAFGTAAAGCVVLGIVYAAGDHWGPHGAPDDLRLFRLIGLVGTAFLAAAVASAGAVALRTAIEEAVRRARQTEQAHQFADALLRAVPVPVLIADNDGRTRDANDAAQLLFGRAAGTVPERLAERLDPLPGGLADESLLRIAEREVVPVHVTRASVVSAEGDRHSLVALTDLGPRFAAESRQVRAAEAEREASAAKSRFLASMSHELRTPLNAILGYTELLQEDLGDGPAAPDLERILGAGRHLLGLIDDVLDISRIEAGRLALVVEERSVAEVLAEAAALARPLLLEHGNRYIVELSADLGFAMTDHRRIRQICSHLLSNAAGCTVAGTIRFHARSEGASIVVEISDTGVGIDDARLSELFQPFGCLDPASASTGPGLGLALSKRLANQLGGDLSASSASGVGSTFVFRFPRQVPMVAPE